MQKYYSNGKLLLSGEYLILDGAKGLALPTKAGQELIVRADRSDNTLLWKSRDQKDQLWFEGAYRLPDLSLISFEGDKNVALVLQKILLMARKAEPKFLADPVGITVTTRLGFPLNWGLGSSSTLISNIAQWAGTDPYQLLNDSFGGSGYDIACARSEKPLLYTLDHGSPIVEQVSFNPLFRDALYFVHLNRKQVSSESIKGYKLKQIGVEQIDSISSLTEKMLTVERISDFNEVLKEHERIISNILGVQPVQEKLFADFPGQTKSLGAWGGDFILATGGNTTKDYFEQKGYDTVIPFSTMIKQYGPQD